MSNFPSLETMVPSLERTRMDGNVRRIIRRSQVAVDPTDRTSNYPKPGMKTVMVRQTVNIESHYPQASIENSHQQNPFSMEDFNMQDGQVINNRENRVAFLDVPQHVTFEQVQAKLATDASLYKTLSNNPVLTDNHMRAIENGRTSKDEIAISQATKYPATDPKAGQLILVEGKIVYRKVFYWNAMKDDQDLRGSGDSYPVPERLKAEFDRASGVVASAANAQASQPAQPEFNVSGDAPAGGQAV